MRRAGLPASSCYGPNGPIARASMRHGSTLVLGPSALRMLWGSSSCLLSCRLARLSLTPCGGVTPGVLHTAGSELTPPAALPVACVQVFVGTCQE